MGRLSPAVRGVIVMAAVIALIGCYVAVKAYHQMHTPLPLIVIQAGR